MLIVAKALKVTPPGHSARAFAAIDVIDWPGGFYRRDIGWRAARDPFQWGRSTPGSTRF
jgi:phosphoribosylamine-glycine ligase